MQLPIITGKPYTPKRNPKEDIPRQEECTNESCPREKPHTHELHTRPPENGTGWLERKANGEIIYHTPWLKQLKPFAETWKRQADPRPRGETPGKTLERLRKECGCVTPEECKKVLDEVTPQGYFLSATNGHWALMKKWNSTGYEYGSLDVSEDHHATTIKSPEFFNVLRRAGTMMTSTRRIHLLARDSKVTLYSEDPDVGDFTETIPVTCLDTDKAWRVALNLDYLKMPLGSWPMTVWVKDEESTVIFEPAWKEWRFVVMPMRTDWERVLKAVS